MKIGKDNSSSKKSKYKNLKRKTIANEFLSNIQLDGLDSFDSETRKAYFDKVITNDFECFLAFNKLNFKKDLQTEYFKYYKEKLCEENPKGTRFDEFLRDEFNLLYDAAAATSAVDDSLNKENEFIKLESFSKVYIDSILYKKKFDEYVKLSQKKQKSFSPSLNQTNRFGLSNNSSITSDSAGSAGLIVPSITIMPSLTFGNSNELNSIIENPNDNYKLSLSDAESDYVKKNYDSNAINFVSSNNNNNNNPFAANSSTQFISSNATLSSSSTTSIQQVAAAGSHNHKLSQSINMAIQSISHAAKHKLSTKLNKSPVDTSLEVVSSNPIDSVKSNNESKQTTSNQISITSNNYLNPKLVPNNLNSGSNINLRNQFQRTTSESSTESSYYTLSMNHHQHHGLTYTKSSSQNQKSLMNYKPGLFNYLKRLNNEKLIFTSNATPISVFSRLPFRSNLTKSELNESFIMSHRARHLSITKTSQSQNPFMNDVFELLDLDFDEYINTGEMSYANLIDPFQQTKQRVFRRALTYEEPKMKEILSDQVICDTLEEDEELKEKEDILPSEPVNKLTLKKETSPFLITAYQPDYLDDPQLTELTAGKNRTCLKFASYAVSIIDYVKPLDLKKEINETFKEKFPFIQISLTKLRSIKRELLEIGVESNLDIIIVAQSYIYFEKLILQGLINKANRKFLAANCLLIAAKLNDVTKKEISKLIDAIIAKFRFDSRKEIISYEFAILVALEFNLMVKYESEFVNHYERLLAKLCEQQKNQQLKTSLE